ncbi:MAG: hypothetical protein AAGF83_27675 [Cyanobacteria bacterium P01_G01_bin.67]
MKEIVATSLELKQKLVDFVYDAEGDLALALESYAAEKGKKNSYGIKQQNLTIDLFLTEGRVKEQNPVEIFLASAIDLSPKNRAIIEKFKHNFIGLFEIKAKADNHYILMNWLTAKTYQVYAHSQISAKERTRLQPGEIIVTILAPVTSTEWCFFSDRIIKGKLSQPKLAVAIGEFRDNYPNFLYADAPELLNQAWDSVAVYHQEFVNYLGSDRLTLAGYKLNQKISELQQRISQKKLAEAGIDTDQSLAEMLSASGTNEADFSETAADLGVDSKAIDQIIVNRDKLSMVTPKVELPPEIRQAEKVTVFSHSQWGQVFLPDFTQFSDLLESENLSETDSAALVKYLRKYLEQPEANYYVWQQLKQKYPLKLEIILQEYLNQTDFELERDLDQLLLKYSKSAIPELPAIANVPIHLNNLFEAAVAQVQKSKSKSTKRSKKKGFLSK